MGKKLKLAKSKTISYLKLPFDFFENHFQSFSPKTVKVYLYILYLCTLGDIEFDDETICESNRNSDKRKKKRLQKARGINRNGLE